jgi:hypothetical protein
MPDRKTLHIDMGEVLTAMDTSEHDMLSWFLDLETGEVRMLYDDHFEGDEDEFAVELERSPDRFEEIPRYETREKYDLMCRFAESIDEEDIREKLALALRGRGAFSRFRDVVFPHPDLSAAWNAMEQDAMLEAAEQWLAGLGINAVYVRPAVEVPPADKAEARPAVAPRIDLLDMLLLGAPDGKNELFEGRVIREIRAHTKPAARAIYKNLARDLCAYYGLAWRNRHIKDKTTFDIERAHLQIRGPTITLAIDMPPETWRAFEP